MSVDTVDDDLLFRLRETLGTCLNITKSDDFQQSAKSVHELVDFLDSIYVSIESDPENDVLVNNALEILSEMFRYISSSSLDQEVIDALSFELPKLCAKFAGVSDKFVDIVDYIINWFIDTCSPRDMLAILCEALDSLSEMFRVTGYFYPLLTGISKVILSIPRRQFEQAKEALPIVLKVLMSVSSNLVEEDRPSEDLFERAISIADSIQIVCKKLEGRLSKKLRSLLGLYVLQIMALVTIITRRNISSSLPLVLRLSRFLQYCGLSYLGALTGSDIVEFSSIILEDCEEDVEVYMRNFLYVRHGACLAVIWGNISSEVTQAANEDVSILIKELQTNQAKRWQAIDMLKHLFSAVNLPWELKKQGIAFLLCIMENISQKSNETQLDSSSYVPSLFAALQAIVLVIIYAPEAVIRKNAFEALKKVLADIPPSPRFDIIKSMISNSISSSLTAILIDLVRGELLKENCQLLLEMKSDEITTFWNLGVLELVEFVLRPAQGGPPSLPEDGEAVLSALNLYRFVLLKESSGKTNYTGALSKVNLRKAYKEWLEPLRTLVTGIIATTKHDDCDQFSTDAICSLNPIELVLYRCIELVEQKLKDNT